MLSQDAELLNYGRALPGTYETARAAALPAEKAYSLKAFWDDVKIPSLVLGLLIGIFYMVNGYIGQQSYQMQQLRTEIISLEKGNETTRLDVARLSSPRRIQFIAESQLGMHVPQKAIYGGRDPSGSQRIIRD